MSFPQSFSRPRRLVVSAIVGVSLIPVGVTVLSSPAGAVAAPVAGPRVLTRTVTLVTGDVVTLTTRADGQQVAEVDRPDSATGGVRLQQAGGDLYVLPDEALGLVRAGKLDRRLFNVTDLVEMGYDDRSTAGLPLIATFAPPLAKARAADPAAPRGSTLRRRYNSIRGAALSADKRQALRCSTAASTPPTPTWPARSRWQSASCRGRTPPT